MTGYATTALVSSVSSELYSAISGISGDFELVAGSGVELVDDPNAKTTTINVTAEGTPVTAIEQMIESATSGISAAISGSYTLVAGNGIQLTDDDTAKTTTISVTAQGGDPEVEQVVKSQSATWDSVTGKQDNLNFEYNNTAISSIDSSGLYDTSAHARINTLAGRINTLSSDKLDTTAFSTVSGDFLTAHQDISDLMPKSESANFYPMTGNPSGFLTAHQSLTGYLQDTDLTIVDNKITEISGVPLSAGDELPSGIMNTSALEYNAVNEISGYNGSAIAQYGAEKQWLIHDDTLVHASNSAQYALGVNLSAVAQLLGIDETVLYSATPKNYGGGSSGETIQLSESISNFKRLRFYLNVTKKDSSGNMTYYDVREIDNFSGSTANFQYGPFPENNVTANWFVLKAGITDNICNVSATFDAYTSVQIPDWGNKWFPGSLYKVVGIGRK